MITNMKSNFYILTGAPGSGKSTLISRLRELEYTCVDEPAREVIVEQKSIGGEGVYEKNPRLFIELMLSRSISRYNQYINLEKPIIFDRGIPDIAAYAKLSDNEREHYFKASDEYQYNNAVFYLPVWDEIYTNDEDRKMNLEAAKDFDKIIRQIYEKIGYEIIEVPLVSVADRVNFIEDRL